MLLEQTHQILGWPEPAQVLDPPGGGPRVYADYAKHKIGLVLQRTFPGLQVSTGILAADPGTQNTETPIAVVCQFPRGASDAVLDEAHRLAWNFSRTALLITLEPTRLIAWSCCRHPRESQDDRQVCVLPSATAYTGDAQQDAIADMLHWISLVTGQLLLRNPKKFPSAGRADSLLLQNLRYIRRQLIDDGMPENYCHDLLARLIFTQFLFHRKDAEGRPFFDERLLGGRCDGTLLKVHDGLASILADKRETYALFQWLDDKFNGDLFPGKSGQSAAERDQAWQVEKDAVTVKRLKMLADFVSGKVDLAQRQPMLWPVYSFDTIPLEFISSVYEEFLNEERLRDKAYYTPSHLVDFVLDGILPWDGDTWNLKILDPSCGSGIFLVKAFQRLIYRWRFAHPGVEPLVSDLKPLLAGNLVGVDKNPEAVRVACFSLYLAMADAIEPKYYLKREKVFPPLRGVSLLAKDFFDETTDLIRTQEDAARYDLVIGNAPWGDRSIKGEIPAGATKARPSLAETWAKEHSWPVANNDIGPVFLGKAAKLVTTSGRVAMIQPASTLLHQRAGLAERLRQKIFTEFSVDEVVNLTAIRRDIFAEAISPACIITFGRTEPDPDSPVFYCAPKPHQGSETQRNLIIEPHDVNPISHHEAGNDALVWTVFALGGRRDWMLVKRLRGLSTLAKLEKMGKVTTRLGVIPGNRERELAELKGKPYFDAPAFPTSAVLELDAATVPKWREPLVASSDSTDVEAFKQPQMLIKQSFSATAGRYRSVRIKSKDPVWGVVCKKTYLSARDLTVGAKHLRAANLAYNSRFAAYFLNLTSSRALYNTELLSEEVCSLPLPEVPGGSAEPATFAEIDALTDKLYKLNGAESALVDDFLETTLPSLLRKKRGVGYRPTVREDARNPEPELTNYAKTFLRVLKGTFGGDKMVSSTIFQDPKKQRLPVRLVGIHLDWPDHAATEIKQMESGPLHQQLQKLYGDALKGRGRATTGEGLGFQRVAFLFHSHQAPHGRVRTLYIIKPDECRYWTRSLAMRDADQLSAAILKAAGHRLTRA